MDATQITIVGGLITAVGTLVTVVTYLFRMHEKDFDGLKSALRACEEDKETLYNKLLEVHYKRPDVLSSSEIPQLPNSGGTTK